MIIQQHIIACLKVFYEPIKISININKLNQYPMHMNIQQKLASSQKVIQGQQISSHQLHLHSTIRSSSSLGPNKSFAQENAKNVQTLLSAVINGFKCSFMLNRSQEQIVIRCATNNNKYLTCRYRYQQLPKALQITYQNIQQLFQQFKYIIDQKQVAKRLKIQDNKFLFHLQTKKKGKSQLLPEMFLLEQETQEKRILRLEEDIQILKSQNVYKNQQISELQQRIKQIQNRIGLKSDNQKAIISKKVHSRLSNHSTIQFKAEQNTKTILYEQEQQSLIKKFKKSKSKQNLLQSNEQVPSILKASIEQYDCFFSLSESNLHVQLQSRKQARIYKCLISAQNIPKQVYSFVPTPQKLYEEIKYIIQNQIQGRIDVFQKWFIYRASINYKQEQTLVEGRFQTECVRQDNFQRIQQLVDIQTQMIAQDVTMLKLQFGILRKSLQLNGIVLEMPLSFQSHQSRIISTDADYITLTKFFTKKISKIDLLYRASDNAFEVRKFHQKCDSIPNTITLVLTQYDKKIGGFTPLPWDRNGNSKYLTDYSSSSFIFSLTNQHKLALEQTQFAIKVSADDGPRFGNGADLAIKQKADQNNNSYANICTSYCHPQYTYKSVESYKKFSGDDKTNRFKVKEWQVYEVIFDD